MTEKPDIDCVGIFPTLAVGDMKETVDWYVQKLGFDVRFFYGDPPTHGGVQLGQATVHFFPGTPNPDQNWIYFQVEDVDEAYEWMHSNDVKMLDKPTDQPWHMREFNLRDPNGYHLRFGAADVRAGDPIPIERSAFHTRIEKRLGALLEDLAIHKKMSVAEVLEETLLHSFETEPSKQGQWVASPHTARTLRFIEQLKSKHSIDYDVHDAYRFQEKEE
ncbi:MAG: VOC family protein [Hyphomicrobiaceae bacterium]